MLKIGYRRVPLFFADVTAKTATYRRDQVLGNGKNGEFVRVKAHRPSNSASKKTVCYATLLSYCN